MATDRGPSPSADQSTRSILRQFDWTAGGSVSTAVIQAVATVSDDAPTELPPLYRTIDPDALDAFFDHDPESSARGRKDVTFAYDGYLVRITSAGDGYVLPGDSEPDV